MDCCNNYDQYYNMVKYTCIVVLIIGVAKNIHECMYITIYCGCGTQYHDYREGARTVGSLINRFGHAQHHYDITAKTPPLLYIMDICHSIPFT